MRPLSSRSSGLGSLGCAGIAGPALVDADLLEDPFQHRALVEGVDIAGRWRRIAGDGSRDRVPIGGACGFTHGAMLPPPRGAVAPLFDVSARLPSTRGGRLPGAA
ncbi:hypothetical protein ASG91_10945 [Phycicoccus sp. Soil802]|nr:hypothetical protein ASG91_10945 [Phycicoccus sp. Soil802]